MPEHVPLDVALGLNRLGAFDRLSRQIVDGQCFTRNAAYREEWKASNRAGRVVAGLGSHVRRRDDGPDLAPSGRKCALDQRATDPFGLLVGQNEELGQLEEAIALDRAREADELRGGQFGHPPLGCQLGEQTIERLAPPPPLRGGSLERHALPRRQVRDGGPHQFMTAHRVIRRGLPVAGLEITAHGNRPLRARATL